MNKLLYVRWRVRPNDVTSEIYRTPMCLPLDLILSSYDVITVEDEMGEMVYAA